MDLISFQLISRFLSHFTYLTFPGTDAGKIDVSNTLQGVAGKEPQGGQGSLEIEVRIQLLFFFLLLEESIELLINVNNVM